MLFLKKLIIFLLFVLSIFDANGQSFRFNSNNERLYNHLINKKKYENLYSRSINIYYSDYSQFIDSLYENHKSILTKQTNILNSKRNNISFAPVIDAKSYSGTELFYRYGIGGQLSYQFKEKLSLQGTYVRYELNLPKYQEDIFDTLPIINNIGEKADSSNFKTSYYTWDISYSPFSYLNLQLGRNKQFVGNGYHSLFYSDWAPPAEYFQINTNVWKIHYRYNISHQKDYDRFNYDNLYEKFTTYHFINVAISEKLSFQVFESIVWQQNDSVGHNGLEINYLNPIIFYRFIEYGLGSAENALVGLGFQWNLFKHTKLYGQFLLDELTYKEFIKFNGYWGNKNGLQLGLKYFNTTSFGDINFLAEYNQVQPFTFSHFKGLQVYSHMHHSLTHPLGAGFRELVFKTDLFKSNWSYSIKTIITQFGTDLPGESQGNNIYVSDRDRTTDYGNKLINGISNKLFYSEVKTGYLINPYWNLKLETGIIYRQHNVNSISQKNFYAFIGLKTNIFREDLVY